MQRWKSELAPTLLLQMEHPPLRLEPLLPDDDPASRLRLTVGQEVPDEYDSDDGEISIGEAQRCGCRRVALNRFHLAIRRMTGKPYLRD
jgi:hypothetical protein